MAATISGLAKQTRQIGTKQRKPYLLSCRQLQYQCASGIGNAKAFPVNKLKCGNGPILGSQLGIDDQGNQRAPDRAKEPEQKDLSKNKKARIRYGNVLYEST
jgi:hypothetical protein